MRRARAAVILALCGVGFLFNMLRMHDSVALHWEIAFFIILALFPSKSQG